MDINPEIRLNARLLLDALNARGADCHPYEWDLHMAVMQFVVRTRHLPGAPYQPSDRLLLELLGDDPK